jgi:histidine ammonia-lyase
MARAAVYGVNTGFGKLAASRSPRKIRKRLQKNLILSHCCGVGEPMPEDVARLMMVLKLLSLGRGASGVRPRGRRPDRGDAASGRHPVIPDQGSVGASGDLAPLAHMTAVMIGHGEAMVDGQIKPGAEALAPKGLSRSPLARRRGWR